MTHDSHNEIAETTMHQSGLAARVLGQIDAEAIAPRPRWHCQVVAYGSWVLWAVSVALGALALSITVYVLTSAPYMMYEATHDTAFTFFMELIPILWLVVLITMLGLAIVEMRRTKRGYRYPLVIIIGSSVALSVVGALFLHLAGFSVWFDTVLGKYMNSYTSFEKMEAKMWHAPLSGRYVGVIVVPAAGLPPAFLPQPEFRDVDGLVWRVITETLTPPERTLLFSAKPVQVIGTSTGPLTLHLCAVLPRFFANHMDNEERMAYKQAYFERVRAFTNRDETRINVMGDDGSADMSPTPEPCHTIQFSRLNASVAP